jgi:acetyl esterase/lipase
MEALTPDRPLPAYTDVTYAHTSAQQRLDLYVPTRTVVLSPVVIWIHGGAFTVGDKRALAINNLRSPPQAAIVPAQQGPLIVSQIQIPDVAALTAKGYAVVGLNYRLATRISSEKEFVLAVQHAVQDAKAAVRFLRANAALYHIDPDKFAAWGNSAGGYIASMLGATGDQATFFDDSSLGNIDVSSAVQAVVDWFGPIDFASDSAQLAAVPACAYLSARAAFPDNFIETAMQYSPLSYIKKASVLPPFLIAHGDADCAVPSTQSQELYIALHEAHAVATLTVLPNIGHEDPAFMRTQMTPALTFLDTVFGKIE